MNAQAPTAEPVLVVHGIGVRDQRGFNTQVQQLAEALGPRYTLIPVHWGELAASTLHLEKIIAAKPATKAPQPVAVKAEQSSWWGGLMEGMGKVLEEGKQAADNRLRGLLRAGISENIIPYLGDILVYQGMRQQFHSTVRSYIPAGYGTIHQPIKAIGHSLGGVVLFDLAVSTTGPAIWFSHLVTLGSQPSFFHLQHRRSDSVDVYAGKPIALPPMLRAWTNVLDEDDWLSFAVEPIFRLADGSSPGDCWVDNTAGEYTDLLTLAAHTAYWGNAEVHAILRESLAAD